MNEAKLLSTILKTSYTKPDVLRRLRLYRSFLEHGFYRAGSKKLRDFLTRAKATSADVESITGWGEEFHRCFTKQNAYTLLNLITSAVGEVPTISLYLPYDPPPSEVTKLGQWFRVYVANNVLLDVHSDPGLLGGCAFAWKGYYRDYSLRYWLSQKYQEIEQMLNRYVTS